MAKKILITNTVALNGGDAAILQSVLHLLRTAFGEDTEFIVYDSSPEIAARYYPTIHFRKLIYWTAVPKSHSKLIRSLGKRWNLLRMHLAMKCWNKRRALARHILTDAEWKDFNHYDSADLIVSTGGTYLVDHYSLAPRIFDYQLSLQMRRPLVFFTQSLGPFKKQPSSTRRELKRIFEKAELILLRDERSFKHLNELQFSAANSKISSDAVFALANPVILKNASISSAHGKKTLNVAISVRDWRRFASLSKLEGMDRYKESLRALTIHLVNQCDASVTFISTCQGIPEYQFDDSKIAAEIVRSLPDEIAPRVQVNADFHSPTELISLLQKFDVAIGTRMHFCILSLLAGVPVLPIAYEFKTNELFSRIGLAEWVQNIETVSPGELIKAFDAFWRDPSVIRSSLFCKVEIERQSALKSGALVRQAWEKFQKVG